MKYLRYDTLGLILFNNMIPHTTMRDILDRDPEDLISAGFISEDGSCCYGESQSLKLVSLDEDTALLKRQFGVRD